MRPKLPPGERRGSSLQVKATRAEVAEWRRRAKRAGISLSAWARGVIIAATATKENQ